MIMEEGLQLLGASIVNHPSIHPAHSFPFLLNSEYNLLFLIILVSYNTFFLLPYNGLIDFYFTQAGISHCYPWPSLPFVETANRFFAVVPVFCLALLMQSLVYLYSYSIGFKKILKSGILLCGKACRLWGVAWYLHFVHCRVWNNFPLQYVLFWHLSHLNPSDHFISARKF